MKHHHRAVRLATPWIAAVVTLMVWELLARALQIKWLPPPSQILSAFAEIDNKGAILVESGKTLVVGLAVMFGASGIVAGAMIIVPLIGRALTPFVDLLLVLPKIALVPAFTLIWGFGQTTRIVTVAVYALGPVIATWVSSMANPPQDLLEMSSSYRSTNLQRIRTILIPAGAPGLVAGLRIGILQGLKGLLTAEVLIAVVGIGQLLKSAASSFQIEKVYAVVLLVMLCSVVAYAVLTTIENRVTRWAARG